MKGAPPRNSKLGHTGAYKTPRLKGWFGAPGDAGQWRAQRAADPELPGQPPARGRGNGREAEKEQLRKLVTAEGSGGVEQKAALKARWVIENSANPNILGSRGGGGASESEAGESTRSQPIFGADADSAGQSLRLSGRKTGPPRRLVQPWAWTAPPNSSHCLFAMRPQDPSEQWSHYTYHAAPGEVPICRVRLPALVQLLHLKI